MELVARYSQLHSFPEEIGDGLHLIRKREKSFLALTLTFIVLLASNVTLFFLWQRNERSFHQDCIRPKLSFSPAIEAIQYEQKKLTRNIENNVFTGQPRPEHDAAWAKLLEPIAIKISEKELSHLEDPSIAFKDGSGYLGELSVYHELHCVKQVRRYLHLEHYRPNMTADERAFENTHIDHCLEYWREAAMCRGDTSLATFFWKDGFPASRVHSIHECVNWELLDSWARARGVKMVDYSIIEGAG